MAIVLCPECKNEVSDSAVQCPKCGYAIQKNRKKSWWESKPFVILFLIIFFPLGFYGLWKNQRFSVITKVILTCLVAICFIGYIASDKGGSTDAGRTATTRSAQAATQPAQPKPISDLTFLTIRNTLKGATEAQFKAYARSIKGTRIRWTGWVEDVNEKAFDDYELWVDMDSPQTTLSVQDVSFDISQELALSFEKNARVTFEGDIGNVLDILGSCQVRLENAVVVSKQ